MTTTDHAHCTVRQDERPAFAARASEIVARLWRAFRNRRAFQRLGEMSDAELADIGLTRADLRIASDPRIGQDPTARLGAVAMERIERTEALARQVH